jgi:hypothetical protein
MHTQADENDRRDTHGKWGGVVIIRIRKGKIQIRKRKILDRAASSQEAANNQGHRVTIKVCTVASVILSFSFCIKIILSVYSLET